MVSSAAISSTRTRERAFPKQYQAAADGAFAGAELRAVTEVVHDLRSPLSSILMLSEALVDRYHGHDDDVATKQAGLIHAAATAMHALVCDLRDTARGPRALIEPSPVKFFFTSIGSTIEDLARPLASQTGVAFRVALPERTVAIGYPTALKRVLLNLVTNSIKYTDRGFVELTTLLRPDSAQFIVRDSGSGLPPHIVALLHGESGDAGEGMDFSVGLGVSLCVRLVRLMNGSIRVRETSRLGTCITVDVPLGLSAAE
jgi:signal transduction histidine kinase